MRSEQFANWLESAIFCGLPYCSDGWNLFDDELDGFKNFVELQGYSCYMTTSEIFGSYINYYKVTIIENPLLLNKLTILEFKEV